MTESNGHPLTLEAILAAEDVQPVRLETPEWGGYVYVRPITSNDRDYLEWWTRENDTHIGFRAMVASKVLCDASGKPLEGMSAANVMALGNKSGNVIDRIVTKAYELAGWTKQEQERLEKNSQSGPSGDSG